MQLLRSLLLEQVVGYYDPARDTLFVMEGLDPALVEPVLAHEIVHALQDQYEDLDSLMTANLGAQRPRDGGSSSARGARDTRDAGMATRKTHRRGVRSRRAAQFIGAARGRLARRGRARNAGSRLGAPTDPRITDVPVPGWSRVRPCQVSPRGGRQGRTARRWDADIDRTGPASGAGVRAHAGATRTARVRAGSTRGMVDRSFGRSRRVRDPDLAAGASRATASSRRRLPRAGTETCTACSTARRGRSSSGLRPGTRKRDAEAFVRADAGPRRPGMETKPAARRRSAERRCPESRSSSWSIDQPAWKRRASSRFSGSAWNPSDAPG